MADDLKKTARKARVQYEKILSVQPNSDCCVGIAASFCIAGEDVIVVARTVAQLDIIYNYIAPGETLRTDHCPNVVVMRRDRSKIDDEL